MDRSALERVLTEQYGNSPDPASRRIVIDFLLETPSLAGEDVHFIKKLTKVAESSYREAPAEFNLHLLDRLLTYNDEGIRLAEDSYERYGKSPNAQKLALHLKGHKATLLSFIVHREAALTQAQRHELTAAADELLEEIVPVMFTNRDYSTLRPLMETMCNVSFALYQYNQDLDLAERVYRATVGSIAITRLLMGSPSSNKHELYPKKDFERKMTLASNIYKSLRREGNHSPEALATWARRAYYSTLDYLPLENREPESPKSKADILVTLGILAEDMIEFDSKNFVSWRDRSRQHYQEFLQFVEQERLINSFPKLIKTAQVGIKITSGYFDLNPEEST